MHVKWCKISWYFCSQLRPIHWRQCWRDVGQQYQISLILLANISPTFLKSKLRRKRPGRQQCWSNVGEMLPRLRLPLQRLCFQNCIVRENLFYKQTTTYLTSPQQISFEMNLVECEMKFQAKRKDGTKLRKTQIQGLRSRKVLDWTFMVIRRHNHYRS